MQDFNTSHVTVYRLFLLISIQHFLFQYISCYCLSFWTSVIFDASENFNTSHVTVYLLLSHPIYQPSDISIHLMLLFISSVSFIFIRASLFQYISCYCLSAAHRPMLRIDLRFQYISCYCLSSVVSSRSFRFFYFNTSHVTVYRDNNLDTSRFCNHFNTSHVTVYQVQTIPHNL